MPNEKTDASGPYKLKSNDKTGSWSAWQGDDIAWTFPHRMPSQWADNAIDFANTAYAAGHAAALTRTCPAPRPLPRRTPGGKQVRIRYSLAHLMRTINEHEKAIANESSLEGWFAVQADEAAKNFVDDLRKELAQHPAAGEGEKNEEV